MNPTFSALGEKLAGPCGIQELMEDLGRALSVEPDMRMLGGGNPAAIPGMQALWREQWQALADTPEHLDRVLVNYDPPAGNPEFLEAFAAFLRRECGWEVQSKNLAVMPGGQAAFFYLQVLLAGGDGKRRMLYPIAPEYIGYANQGLHPDALWSVPGAIEERADHRFKYHIDFDRLKVDTTVAAVCLSCPTNPSGNVVGREELLQLRERAMTAGVPLILDQAYGMPFPGAIYTDWEPIWGEDMIVSISLSKLGLPGVRTSVIVAHEKIASALANLNSVAALANGNLGQALIRPLLEGDQLPRCSREIIRPFYQQRRDLAEAVLRRELGDLPYALHESEGAFFLWLWLKDCPVKSAELYQRLKQRKVLVVPGHYFFFGLDEPWSHQDECLRITYSQPEAVVEEGLTILAEEVRLAYQNA